MKRIAIFYLLPFLFFASSCASILNSKKVKLRIFTGKDESLVLNGDTVKTFRGNAFKYTYRAPTKVCL